MRGRILRLTDANVNRVSEGLRVLEDVARFIVDDEKTSRQLKSARHDLVKSAESLGLELLENRDVPGDIGAEFDIAHDLQDLVSMVRANSKRAQEGLRVLEELSKLPDVKSLLSTNQLKEWRYMVYQVEKELVRQLLKKPGTS